MVGVEILTGISGPTSMAVRMAEDLNITLIGFLRENSMSIYTHPERILSSACHGADHPPTRHSPRVLRAR
jgi:hypothetical protein